MSIVRVTEPPVHSREKDEGDASSSTTTATDHGYEEEEEEDGEEESEDNHIDDYIREFSFEPEIIVPRRNVSSNSLTCVGGEQKTPLTCPVQRSNSTNNNNNNNSRNKVRFLQTKPLSLAIHKRHHHPPPSSPTQRQRIVNRESVISSKATTLPHHHPPTTVAPPVLEQVLNERVCSSSSSTCANLPSIEFKNPVHSLVGKDSAEQQWPPPTVEPNIFIVGESNNPSGDHHHNNKKVQQEDQLTTTSFGELDFGEPGRRRKKRRRNKSPWDRLRSALCLKNNKKSKKDHLPSTAEQVNHEIEAFYYVGTLREK